MDLRHKQVIVTGGVRGIGRCLVDRLRALDAHVTVFDRDAAGLGALREQCPEVHGVECDVSDDAQVGDALDRYHQRVGSADVLVNNAGILYSAPLVRLAASGQVERHDVAMWHRVLASDLSSVFFMTSHVVRAMVTARTKGVVVNISSVSAAGNPGQSAYSAAKAGVNALTAVWAKELGPLGIRVAAVAPGFTDTRSLEGALTESARREAVRRIPVRRLARPEEIAEGVIAVIRHDYFVGKVFELDGGLVV
jgi:3-oxoacyl-[acyl-carrier protein] reductase